MRRCQADMGPEQLHHTFHLEARSSCGLDATQGGNAGHNRHVSYDGMDAEGFRQLLDVVGEHTRRGN